MDQKKTKSKGGAIVSAIFHYLLLVIVVAAIIVFSVFKANIDALVLSIPDTPIEGLNTAIDFLPKVGAALIAAAIMFAVVWLINILIKLNIGLTFKGKTLYKVIMSIIKWVAIVAGIIAILAALGVDPTALVVSAGVITLVVGLSAQSLISDILAGLFIVIEGEYLIDDIVVVDGFRGKVKSVGIRTTSIVDIGGNVKVVNNSEIKTVVNLTNNKSLAKVTIYIASSENLKETEKTFESYFPKILESIKKYNVNVIIYKGVASMDANGMAMIYAVPCFEEDIYEIERMLYRQFKYIMDEHNISNNEPYVIYDRTKELAPHK